MADTESEDKRPAMTRVWDHSTAVGTHLDVLMGLAHRANRDGSSAYRSVAGIAERLQITERRAYQIVSDLRDAGELKIEKQRQGTSNVYRIVCCTAPVQPGLAVVISEQKAKRAERRTEGNIRGSDGSQHQGDLKPGAGVGEKRAAGVGEKPASGDHSFDHSYNHSPTTDDGGREVETPVGLASKLAAELDSGRPDLDAHKALVAKVVAKLPQHAGEQVCTAVSIRRRGEGVVGLRWAYHYGSARARGANHLRAIATADKAEPPLPSLAVAA
jgi:hypothetical protein